MLGQPEIKALLSKLMEGHSIEIEDAFASILASKITDYLEEAKFEYAQKMFRAGVDESDEEIDEVLSKSAPVGEWITDFESSDDPRFKGKSKEKRRQMALAAYYAAN